MLYVVVGERCNTRGRVTNSEGTARSVYGDLTGARYWRIQRAIQAFTAKQRDLITSLIEPDPRDELWWMNFLLPHPTPGAWTRQEAEKARAVFGKGNPTGKHVVIVCCGTRPCRAIVGKLDSYPEQLGAVAWSSSLHCWVTRMPHPSGRNLQWNDAANMAVVRERFTRRIQEIRDNEA